MWRRRIICVSNFRQQEGASAVKQQKKRKIFAAVLAARTIPQNSAQADDIAMEIRLLKERVKLIERVCGIHLWPKTSNGGMGFRELFDR
jgi:hypothetical protein